MYVTRFWDSNRWTVGVAREGRSLVHVVSIDDSGVRSQRLPLEETKTFQKVSLGRRGDYPLGRACRKMLAVGRRAGITKDAREILQEGLECAA